MKFLQNNYERFYCDSIQGFYIQWKGNKCHPCNSRRERLKGPKSIQGVKKVSNILRGVSTHANKEKSLINTGPEMHTF